MQSISAKSLRALVLMVAVVLVGSGVLAFAQGTSGSLSGQISDPMGAAVVGAKVTLTNVDTNLVQAETSDNTGSYLLKPVMPGKYSLTITAKGFAVYVQRGIVITVNQYATLDVHLKLASANNEVVTVTADAELINTTSAELGSTVNEAAISELPLNGRDPSSLVLLAPGTDNVLQHGGEGIQTGFSFPNETGASANGGRQGSTFYMLDGVTNMDNYNDLTAPFPNADATQEFKVITNNFSAQYGFSPGAVVSSATSSAASSAAPSRRTISSSLPTTRTPRWRGPRAARSPPHPPRPCLQATSGACLPMASRPTWSAPSKPSAASPTNSIPASPASIRLRLPSPPPDCPS
jgi:hypothetical protein